MYLERVNYGNLPAEVQDASAKLAQAPIPELCKFFEIYELYLITSVLSSLLI